MTRYVTYFAVGLLGGAAAVITAGLGYVLIEQQAAYKRTLTRRARAVHPITK